MDVIDAEQARIAEEAGACAVMALERVPADIRKNGNAIHEVIMTGGLHIHMRECVFISLLLTAHQIQYQY